MRVSLEFESDFDVHLSAIRYLPEVVDIVTRLSEMWVDTDLAEFNFTGTPFYLCISFGGHVLWDSECNWQDGVSWLEEDYDNTPTLQNCLRMLEDYSEMLASVAREK